jgi:hypothetical protein
MTKIGELQARRMEWHADHQFLVELAEIKRSRHLTTEEEQKEQSAIAHKNEVYVKILELEPQAARERIEGLVTELEPNAHVQWDESRVPNSIRFRAVHRATETVLIESSGDWLAGEILDKTDPQLRALLNAWSNGRL